MTMRENNEDTVFQKVYADPSEDATGLFLVADGVGGRLAGEAASYWAAEAVKNSLSDLIDHRDPRATLHFEKHTLRQFGSMVASGLNPDDLHDRVLAAVEKANQVVRTYAQNKPDEAWNAGSTLSMALVNGLDAVVANVGDSRTYLLREGQLRQITKDHSVIQRLIDEGQAQPEELHTHTQRHVIYRSLGAKDTVATDVFRLTLAPGDLLLLCTDGLWEMLKSAADIVRLIYDSPSMMAACENLVAAANAAGGEDNIGVVLVRVFE